FAIQDSNGNKEGVQSWPLAYWPDGSFKWTGHAAPPLDRFEGDVFLSKENVTPNEDIIMVQETEAHIHVNTGKIQCHINKSGEDIFQAIEREGKTLLENGKLVVIRQDGAEEYIGSTQTALFLGEIRAVMVEQEGLVRTVIKIEGSHIGEN